MFFLATTTAGATVGINIKLISKFYASDSNVTTCAFTDGMFHIDLDMPFGMFVSKLQEAGLLEKED